MRSVLLRTGTQNTKEYLYNSLKMWEGLRKKDLSTNTYNTSSDFATQEKV